MKRNFFRILAIAGVLTGGSLLASAEQNLRVNVPFSFVLAGTEFQPGAYTLKETSNGVLTVYGEGRTAIVITSPGETNKASNTALQFVNNR